MADRSYDPDLNLLYWTTGNPGPDWNPDNRPGDNLYTNALLAIDPSTGAIKWHFRFTPGDMHDWDANQMVILFEAPINGRERKLVAQANRNAFYYLLDRATGEFITAAPFSKQTWAERLDAKGRPIRKPGTAPSVGRHPAIRRFRVPPTGSVRATALEPACSIRSVREMSTYFFKGEAKYTRGAPFVSGGGRAVTGDEALGVIRALEATTRQIEIGIPAPVTRLGQSDGHSRRSRLRRDERGEPFCARRRNR